MAFNFPTAPVAGQAFTPPGGPTYVFDGAAWLVPATGPMFSGAPDSVDALAAKIGFQTAGGTANVLTLTPAAPLAAYVDMDIISFEAIATNTGAATLNVSGLGAKAIRRMYADVDTALVGKEIINGGRYWAQYDTAAAAGAGAWILLNGSNPEFTWTPILEFGAASVGITYTTQAGTYQRISDKLWYAQFNIVLSSKGSSVGNATIGGFPMTISNGGVLLKSYGGMDAISGGIILDIQSGASFAKIRTNGAASSTDLTDVNFTNTSALTGGGVIMSTLVV